MNAPLPHPLIVLQDPNAQDDVFGMVRSGQMAASMLIQCAEQFQSAGHLQEASELYALWLAHHEDPLQHILLFNHGSILQQIGSLTLAQRAYEEALQRSPDFAEAAINLGLVLEKQGQADRAIDAWARLAGQRYSHRPVKVELLTTALNHIGRVHENQRRYELALLALEHSLALNKKQPGVLQHWVHIRQKACAWPVYKPLPGVTRNEMLMSTSPLAMLALTEDPVLQLLCARSFVSRTYGFKEDRICKVESYSHKKKRIGIVSSDLREHAVGFLLPTFLSGICRERHELYAYDFTKIGPSALRQAILAGFDHVRPIQALSDRDAAELILSDEIDVLIDLNGLSSGARPGIFALHPAPLQGTYLGFMGSTGMPWFDFVIADRNALPPENTDFFMERPLYVDDSFIPIPSTTSSPARAKRAEIGLPEDAFVMGAFGNVYKITPEMYSVWLDLLERIPSSILWLIDDNPLTTHNLKRVARESGSDLSRILFTPRTPPDEFCRRLTLCDVYLDTYPYNCGSTSIDVIQANVPLVTRYGATMVSRMGLSILKALDACDTAVSDFEKYRDKVINIYQYGFKPDYAERIKQRQFKITFSFV